MPSPPSHGAAGLPSAGANLGLAFVTGVTTRGLGCLAVQAGLLATSVARQAETDVVAELAAERLIRRKKKRPGRKLTQSQRRKERAALAVLEVPARPKRRRALPILLFLGAKLRWRLGPPDTVVVLDVLGNPDPAASEERLGLVTQEVRLPLGGPSRTV